MFGLAAVPLVTVIGAATDYTRAVAVRERLNIIADAAVLEAVGKGSVATRWNKADRGEADTKALFLKNAQSIPDTVVDPPAVKIQQTSSERRVTLDYTATLTNTFGAFIAPTTKIRGTASSAVTRPIYMDFHLLLDNSPSMGLAATIADIQKMELLTTGHPSHPKCAFACHEANNPNDHYRIARNNNVKLRIDLVREATQRLIETAGNTEVVTDQFRIGLYTLNMSLQQVSALTADLAAVKTAAENVQLVTLPYNGHNGNKYTNFTGLIPYADLLPHGGDGLSSGSPQTVLFLVSDGVADETTAPRVKVVPAALCDKIKAKNIKIAALYTTYYPLPGNSAYESEVKPIAHNIAPAMQACASPGLYFEVSPNQGISEAMQALFQKAVGEARLTK
jgi:Flp pilus assembly protein TadG